MAAGASLTVVTGPTASGKSALGLALAERTGADVLSADSMAVYKGMDVGTAKPTADERARVRHWGVDLVEPGATFAVADWVAEAERAIAAAPALVIVGGTPLYLKALFEGLFDGPPADLALRERLMSQGPDALHARLTQVDPESAARLHRNDVRRVVRALEVFELTGVPISAQQREWSAGTLRHDARWFGLAWEKEALSRRINARVKAMLAAGWLDEVRDLVKRPLARTAAEATGYAELIAVVEGRLTLDDATERIKIATRQLARAQMKWLRRWPQVTWLDGPSASVGQVLSS